MILITITSHVDYLTMISILNCVLPAILPFMTGYIFYSSTTRRRGILYTSEFLITAPKYSSFKFLFIFIISTSYSHTSKASSIFSNVSFNMQHLREVFFYIKLIFCPQNTFLIKATTRNCTDLYLFTIFPVIVDLTIQIYSFGYLLDLRILDYTHWCLIDDLHDILL